MEPKTTSEDLAELIKSLTPREQDAVLQFIDYLRGLDLSGRSRAPLLQAADEFIAEHPELLRQLGW